MLLRPRETQTPVEVFMKYGVALVTAFFVAVMMVPLAAGQSQKSPLFLVPPLLAKPTATSVTVSVVAGSDTVACYVRYGEESTQKASWAKTPQTTVAPGNTGEITLSPLKTDSRYRYEVLAAKGDGKQFTPEGEGFFRTMRSGPPFSFVLFSDSHLTPFNRERVDILKSVGASAAARKPDFAVMLGDNIQTFTSHGGPLGERSQGITLYRILRHALADFAPAGPVFMANGNWEGENGWHPQDRRQWAADARKAYLPGPDDKTYPQGGSPNQDYYAYTWGNALFVVLNVTGYTKIDHGHTTGVGKADDWTLGEEQKAWLKKTLAASKERWKFIMMHHTVGGNAGDDVNTRYGRGGGRAAKVGEQATVHEWMKQYGVQVLFYGHDHVFTDIPVDGIHYICVGSAGAPWKFATDETGYTKYWPESGYTLVEVGTDSAKISFVDPTGSAKEGRILNTITIR
jgi:3',5'-cyclic AMP phosphodiesterase CpdA